VFPEREIRKERITDGIEDGEVCNLERRRQWKIGRVEEGLLTSKVVVVVRGWMRSASSHQNIQRRRGVVADVDGKIKRVGNASLAKP
jgi:hypothetical protein